MMCMLARKLCNGYVPMYTQILNSHASDCGYLGDYCDGKLFHENLLFQEDPCALQIQLYYDELEVCNPLGSKAKKHKLGNI